MTFISFKDPVEAGLIMDPLLLKMIVHGISFNFDFVQTLTFGRFQVVHMHLAKYCAASFNFPITSADRFAVELVLQSWQNLSRAFDLRELPDLRWHWAGLICA